MTSVSCAWCHEMVAMVGPSPTCRACGHQAGVPRMECACPSCSSRRSTPTVRIDSDEIKRLLFGGTR